MNERVKRISAEAKGLSPDDLAELVDDLLVCLHEADPQIEMAWLEEAERRWQDVVSGKAELIDADTVFTDIRDRLTKDRNERSS